MWSAAWLFLLNLTTWCCLAAEEPSRKLGGVEWNPREVDRQRPIEKSKPVKYCVDDGSECKACIPPLFSWNSESGECENNAPYGEIVLSTKFNKGHHKKYNYGVLEKELQEAVQKMLDTTGIDAFAVVTDSYLSPGFAAARKAGAADSGHEDVDVVVCFSRTEASEHRNDIELLGNELRAIADVLTKRRKFVQMKDAELVTQVVSPDEFTLYDTGRVKVRWSPHGARIHADKDRKPVSYCANGDGICRHCIPVVFEEKKGRHPCENVMPFAEVVLTVSCRKGALQSCDLLELEFDLKDHLQEILTKAGTKAQVFIIDSYLNRGWLAGMEANPDPKLHPTTEVDIVVGFYVPDAPTGLPENRLEELKKELVTVSNVLTTRRKFMHLKEAEVVTREVSPERIKVFDTELSVVQWTPHSGKERKYPRDATKPIKYCSNGDDPCAHCTEPIFQYDEATQKCENKSPFAEVVLTVDCEIPGGRGECDLEQLQYDVAEHLNSLFQESGAGATAYVFDAYISGKWLAAQKAMRGSAALQGVDRENVDVLVGFVPSGHMYTLQDLEEELFIVAMLLTERRQWVHLKNGKIVTPSIKQEQFSVFDDKLKTVEWPPGKHSHHPQDKHKPVKFCTNSDSPCQECIKHVFDLESGHLDATKNRCVNRRPFAWVALIIRCPVGALGFNLVALDAQVKATMQSALRVGGSSASVFIADSYVSAAWLAAQAANGGEKVGLEEVPHEEVEKEETQDFSVEVGFYDERSATTEEFKEQLQTITKVLEDAPKTVKMENAKVVRAVQAEEINVFGKGLHPVDWPVQEARIRDYPRDQQKAIKYCEHGNDKDFCSQCIGAGHIFTFDEDNKRCDNSRPFMEATIKIRKTKSQLKTGGDLVELEHAVRDALEKRFKASSALDGASILIADAYILKNEDDFELEPSETEDVNVLVVIAPGEGTNLENFKDALGVCKMILSEPEIDVSLGEKGEVVAGAQPEEIFVWAEHMHSVIWPAVRPEVRPYPRDKTKGIKYCLDGNSKEICTQCMPTAGHKVFTFDYSKSQCVNERPIAEVELSVHTPKGFDFTKLENGVEEALKTTLKSVPVMSVVADSHLISEGPDEMETVGLLVVFVPVGGSETVESIEELESQLETISTELSKLEEEVLVESDNKLITLAAGVPQTSFHMWDTGYKPIHREFDVPQVRNYPREEPKPVKYCWDGTKLCKTCIHEFEWHLESARCENRVPFAEFQVTVRSTPAGKDLTKIEQHLISALSSKYDEDHEISFYAADSFLSFAWQAAKEAGVEDFDSNVEDVSIVVVVVYTGQDLQHFETRLESIEALLKNAHAEVLPEIVANVEENQISLWDKDMHPVPWPRDKKPVRAYPREKPMPVKYCVGGGSQDRYCSQCIPGVFTYNGEKKICENDIPFAEVPFRLEVEHGYDLGALESNLVEALKAALDGVPGVEATVFAIDSYTSSAWLTAKEVNLKKGTEI